MLPITCANLNPVSEVYYRRTREARYGKRVEELSPIGLQREEHWKRLQEAFGVVASLLEGKKFVLGDTISFTDVTIASWVLWIKRSLGAESQEWKISRDGTGEDGPHTLLRVCRIRKGHRVRVWGAIQINTVYIRYMLSPIVPYSVSKVCIDLV
jgi:hypothetical protein